MGLVLSIPFVLLARLSNSDDDENESTTRNDTSFIFSSRSGAATSNYGTGPSKSLLLETNSTALKNGTLTDSPLNELESLASVVVPIILVSIGLICLYLVYIRIFESSPKKLSQQQQYLVDRNRVQTSGYNYEEATFIEASTLPPPEKAYLKMEDVETLVGEEEFEYDVVDDLESVKTKY